METHTVEVILWDIPSTLGPILRAQHLLQDEDADRSTRHI